MTTTSRTTETTILAGTPLTASSGSRWGILASIFTISALTLVVKLVAFGKDLVAAHHFGTSDEMDAFLIAFLIPALIPMIFAQSIPIALVPAYADTLAVHGSSSANRLAVQGIWLYAVQLGAVIGITYVAQPWIIPMLTHKFSPEKQALTATLFRHLLPFAFCYGLSFGFINWLQANKRFVLCSVAPALIPLTTLGFLMGTGKTLGVWSFIYGTNLGSLLLLAVLIIATATQSDQSLLRPGKLDAATKRLGRESLPLLAGGLLMVGLPVLDQMMAGWLEPGSVAVLNYGEKICSIALSLVACAAGQALFPYLSELVGRRDWAGLKSTTIRYSVLIIGCSLPVVAIFWVTAPSIVKMLFESGAFDGEDTIRVAEVLRYLSLQIPFYIAAVLASRVILALRAGMVILVTTLVNLALNAALNLLLMRTMGVAGLALATACVYLLSAIMLYGAMFYILPRRIRQEPSLQS